MCSPIKHDIAKTCLDRTTSSGVVVKPATHPATAPAWFLMENASKCWCGKRRAPRPTAPPARGGGSVLRGAKKGWEIVSGRSWRALGALKSIKSNPPERQERAKRRQETKKQPPGVDLGMHLGSKMMSFGGYSVFLPSAVLIVLLACFRFSRSALFLC